MRHLFSIALLLASALANAQTLECYTAERFGTELLKVGDSERAVIEKEPDREVQMETIFGGAAGYRYDFYKRNRTIQVYVRHGVIIPNLPGAGLKKNRLRETKRQKRRREARRRLLWAGRWISNPPEVIGRADQRSNRSSVMTLVHASTKSCTNFSRPSLARGVNFRDRPQLGVGAEDQVDRRGRPLQLAA